MVLLLYPGAGHAIKSRPMRSVEWAAWPQATALDISGAGQDGYGLSCALVTPTSAGTGMHARSSRLPLIWRQGRGARRLPQCRTLHVGRAASRGLAVVQPIADLGYRVGTV